MARAKLILKAAWLLLLCLCLLVGEGRADGCAKDQSRTQFVLVLDFCKASQGDQAREPLLQAANLLVHLLQDDDYLGLVATEEPQRVALPPGALSPEQRTQALAKLATLVLAAPSRPYAEVVGQALEMFKPEGPKQRALLILSDRAGEFDHQNHILNREGVEKLAAQAKAAGVTVYAASLASPASAAILQTLAQVTGGRVWEGKTVSDLELAMLHFYQRVRQPQEVPITGNDFRLDPWVRQAAVAAARSTPGQSAVLITPRGDRLTPRTSTKTVRWQVYQEYDLIIISQPRPGTWRLAGARPGDSRVFLDTDLTLGNAGAPREVGEDEALLITAVLSGPQEVTADAKFRAEFQVNNCSPLTTELHVPETEQNQAFPPEARVGRFPPRHLEGEGTLRIMAQGRGFQRLVSLPLTVTPPWYRALVPKAEGDGLPLIRFQPEPSRRPEGIGGTLAWQSAQGALAGAFINPAPGSEIVMARPRGFQDFSLADLHLKGTGPGGRPLEIVSGPQRLMTSKTTPDKPQEMNSPPAWENKPQSATPTTRTQRLKRRWLWLALMGAGVAVFLGAAFLLVRERLTAGNEEGEDSGAPAKNILRLQAQVEALTKEKVQLQAALEEKTRQADQILAEKADLEKDLERFREKSQGSNKTLEELEKKLEEAEREAKGVQGEYLALYARSQKEKEGFQKK